MMDNKKEKPRLAGSGGGEALEQAVKEVLPVAEKPSDLAGIGVPPAAGEILEPPKVILVQPTTKTQIDVNGKEARPGEFFHLAKRQIYKELPVIILGFSLERVLWSDDEKNPQVLCRSRDAIRGTNYGLCSQCQYSKWNGNQPPKCKLFMRLVCLDADGDPFLLTAKGVSFSPARRLINSILGARLPLFAFEITIKSELVEGKNRRFYRLKFERGPIKKFEEMKNFAAVAQRVFSENPAFRAPFRSEWPEWVKENKKD